MPERDSADDGIERRRRYIVCGDNSLSYRLIAELGALPDTDVVVVSRRRPGGASAVPGVAPDVEPISVDQLDEAAFQEAGLGDGEAIAFLDQNDIENLDAALLARELAPSIRIVVRMFDDVLAASVHELVSDCVVLSATAVAAPAFVAAVGGQTPTPLLLFGRSLFVTERDRTRPEDVVCGLAIADGVAEPLVLPDSLDGADIVLTSAVSVAETEHGPASVADVHRRARRRALLASLSLIGTRLRPVIAALLVIVLVGTVTLTPVDHVNWWQGFYLAVLSTLGGASPDLAATPGLQVLHIIFTVLSIAVIPLVTAAVVETVVSARLALASGGLVGPVESHVVVVGLGDLGTRVLIALDDLGIGVVGVDRDPQARGVEVARERRIPVIVGDAGRQETLRSASVHTARTVVVLTSSDLVNVQAALLGLQANPGVRAVLRVFDTEFAARVHGRFGFTSRSVSALSAPSFAAAMLDRAGRRLTRTDTLLAITSRDGLGDLLHRAASGEEPQAITPYDAPPPMPRPSA